jgi:dihydropteroate synthase
LTTAPANTPGQPESNLNPYQKNSRANPSGTIVTSSRIMGILNVTPDSFSDGGVWLDPERALQHALDMAECGADIIDVGGESTRPGAEPVDTREELQRVIPVVEAISAHTGLLVSIDTSKPEVMRAAVAAGAGMINDVLALQHPGALETAAALGVDVCLMHMQGEPRVMQQEPRYGNVVAEVEAFLLQRASACEQMGIQAERIILDPGFGFGKNLQHNLALFRALPRLCSHGYPVLAGLSRKSMLGTLTGRDVDQRMPASVAAAALAVRAGVSVVRVHDVAESRDALQLVDSIWPSGLLEE